MMSSDHAYGRVTPKTYYLIGVFFPFILSFIFITISIDFVSFLKGRILREFQNIKKFVIFWSEVTLSAHA